MTDEVQKSLPETPITNDAVVQTEAAAIVSNAEAPKGPKPFRGSRQQRGGQGRGAQGRGRGRGDKRPPKADVPAESDYEEKNIEVSRVTRVTKGGKRMRFRVLAVIGNHKGRVGYGLAKGLDVAAATQKATNRARKALITVLLHNETIPHAVRIKHGAAQMILKPAPKGTGVKAGGPVRSVLELAGVPNVTAKILGTKNKISNVKAVFEALGKLSLPEKIAQENAESAKQIEATAGDSN